MTLEVGTRVVRVGVVDLDHDRRRGAADVARLRMFADRPNNYWTGTSIDAGSRADPSLSTRATGTRHTRHTRHIGPTPRREDCRSNQAHM